MPSEEIIVLASSRKLGGRCIAGISTGSGKWIRPVSGLDNGQLKPYHCEVNGRWPELLDVVHFKYESKVGSPAQPENVLVADDDWRLAGRLGSADAYSVLGPHLVDGPELLGNRGTAVNEDVAVESLDASLALVEPTGPVTFLMRPAEETHGKLKPRVAFNLDGKDYELNLTDFVVRPRVLEVGCGRHDAEDLGFEGEGRLLLTISLAEVQNGWHTKLAAAVLFLP